MSCFKLGQTVFELIIIVCFNQNLEAAANELGYSWDLAETQNHYAAVTLFDGANDDFDAVMIFHDSVAVPTIAHEVAHISKRFFEDDEEHALFTGYMTNGVMNLCILQRKPLFFYFQGQKVYL